jgi:lysophospholipase L1-like esterase
MSSPKGLNGRTTAYDDHLADCDRTARVSSRRSCTHHAPLDLIVFMLGSNDMKPIIHGTAFGAVKGIERLVNLGAQARLADGNGGGARDSHRLAAAALRDGQQRLCPPCSRAGVEQSAMLAPALSRSRRRARLRLLRRRDRWARTTPIDGVHLDAENTRAVGRGLELSCG